MSSRQICAAFLAATLLVVTAGAVPATGAGSGDPSPQGSTAPTGDEGGGETAKPPVPEPTYTNDQLVKAELDASGLPKTAQLFNRIETVDRPNQTITPVTATSDVRYVDRSGAPKIQGNTVALPIGGTGVQSVTTQATFGKPLPVALHAEYVKDGQAVDPDAILGAAGTVTIRYTATNTVLQRETLHYEDADGNPLQKEEPVFAPFAGVIRAVVPANSQLLNAPESMSNTLPDGQTELMWNLVLYPPMGDPQQTVELTMSAESIHLPDLQLEVTPVVAGQDPFAGFAADMLEQSAKGNTEMAAGLTKIDSATAQLATGTSQLASGLDEMATGLDALGEGNSELAVGAGKSRKASAQLASGAKALSKGISKLAAGLSEMAGSQGLPAAVTGTEALISGLNAIVAKVGSKSDGPIPWPPDPSEVTLVQALRAAGLGSNALELAATGLSTAIAATKTGVDAVGTSAATVSTDAASAEADATTAESNANDAWTAAGCTEPPSAGLCTYIKSAITAAGTAKTAAASAKTGADGIESAVTDPLGLSDQLEGERVAAAGLAFGLGLMSDALAEMLTGVEELSEALKSTTPGATSLYGGLVELEDALELAASAASQMSGGAAVAESGSVEIADGQEALTGGLGTLQTGAEELAVGALKASAGSQELASGGNELAAGAEQLHSEGTSQMLNQVVDASKEPALANAYLDASTKMVAAATPYPPPTGATGRIAYVYSLTAPQPRPAVDWPLLILGVLALVALGILATLRIRRPTPAGDGPA